MLRLAVSVRFGLNHCCVARANVRVMTRKNSDHNKVGKVRVADCDEEKAECHFADDTRSGIPHLGSSC